jgi:hypothetical protein
MENKTKASKVSKAKTSKVGKAKAKASKVSKAKTIKNENTDKYLYIGCFIEPSNAGWMPPEITILEFNDKDLGERFHHLASELCDPEMDDAMGHFVGDIFSGIINDYGEEDILGEQEYIDMTNEMSNSFDEKWRKYSSDDDWLIKDNLLPKEGVKGGGIYYMDPKRMF